METERGKANWYSAGKQMEQSTASVKVRVGIGDEENRDIAA